MNLNPYAEAGVDTEKGDALVSWLQKGAKNGARTSRKIGKFGKPMESIGGFASLFKLAKGAVKSPVLVASTDGVGTKLLLGLEQDQLGGLGQDLVAMCVNDLYCVGARPLFFLDYFATGKLDERQFKIVLAGIQQACLAATMPLVGGETAELPGLYEKNHFDLAGFVVGLADEKKILGADRARSGDLLIGLASSGFHSNGFSLIRKWLQKKSADATLMRRLLEPTTIYHQIPDLLEKCAGVHALAHITGGGISGNLPRVLPKKLNAHIDFRALKTPEWMRSFIEDHSVGLRDVEPTFNLGVGMIAVTAKTSPFLKAAARFGLQARVIGEVRNAKKSQSEAQVIYEGLN